MCGIFAYLGHTSLPVLKVLRLLKILESDQEPGEKTPVGGHGAGIAYMSDRRELILAKVGKTKPSPVKDLTSQLKPATLNSNFILGHVRRASPQFEDTTQYREFAQPYKPNCKHNINLVSAHNGLLQNYQQLKNKLTQPHHFESEKIKLNDSEVITHLYEELLTQTKDPTKAAHILYEQIEGNNTAVILTINKKEAHINAIQKGKTRGLVIWTNPKGEALICSRQKPIQKTLQTLLQENNYKQMIHITHNDTTNIEAHLTLNPAPRTQIQIEKG
jgi:glucosamine 6-phosphate synthetase-like amidotransferase/phosphosugar isomerase protein